MFKRLRQAISEITRWKDFPNAPLSSLAMKHLREKSMLFLKLDLAYVLVAGILILVFRTDRHEVMAFATSFRWFIIALIAIALFDWAVEVEHRCQPHLSDTLAGQFILQHT